MKSVIEHAFKLVAGCLTFLALTIVGGALYLLCWIIKSGLAWAWVTLDNFYKPMDEGTGMIVALMMCYVMGIILWEVLKLFKIDIAGWLDDEFDL